MTLHLPRLGLLGPGTRLESLFWVAWTAHVAFFTHMVLTSEHASLARVMIMAPFWVVSVFLVCRLSFAMFGHTIVELSPSEVAVVRRLAIGSFKHQAPTSHWLGARVQMRSTRRRVFTTCVLSVGIKELEFGKRLTLAEQEWAVAILNDWMARRSKSELSY